MAKPRGPCISGGSVCVVGAGGLGCAVLPSLARMSIDRLVIIDGDRVEAGNLERQPLYEEVDIGQPKASTAALWIRQILAGGQVVAHDVFLNERNAPELLAGHDVVVEGVDDLHAKAMIDKVCLSLGVPLVSGGVHDRQGQLIVLHVPGERAGLCRSDIFSGSIAHEQDGCDMRNVPLPLLEEVGQKMTARVRAILQGSPLSNGRIELFVLGRPGWISVDPQLS